MTQLIAEPAPRRDKRHEGYILLELLVTVVIMAGGIFFLVDSVRQAAQLTRQLQSTHQALTIAVEVVDRIGAHRGTENEPEAGEKLVNGLLYRWWLSELCPVQVSGLGTELRAGQVIVSWRDRKDLRLALPFVWSQTSRELVQPDSP